MRISDWSSDVCSSDLPARQDPGRVDVLRAQEARWVAAAGRRQYLPAEGTCRGDRHRDRADPQHGRGEGAAARERAGVAAVTQCAGADGRDLAWPPEIGRESSWERVCQYG